MKKLNSFSLKFTKFCILMLIAFSVTSVPNLFSQSQFWYLPGGRITLTPPTITNSPYPSYNDPFPNLTSGIYDNSNQTLFYLDGQDIKNSAGITTFTIPEDLQWCSEFEIIPFYSDHSCTVNYHIFYHYYINITGPFKLVHRILDYNGYEIPLANNIISTGSPGGSSQGYAVSKLTTNNTRFIYYIDYVDYPGLTRIEFDDNLGTPSVVRALSDLPITGAPGPTPLTPLELELDHQNNTIAYTMPYNFANTGEVGIVNLATSNGAFLSQEAISIGTQNGYAHCSGVEFNTTGTKLFISHRNGFAPAENGIYVYDLIAHSLSGPILGTTGTNDSYGLSQLELTPSGYIVAANDDGIIFIDPTTETIAYSFPIATAIDHAGMAGGPGPQYHVLPDQVDGETYPLVPIGQPSSCCSMTHQIVNPSNPTLPININDPSLAGYFAAGSTLYIDRPVVINVALAVFNNLNINFGLNGYIIVDPGRTLSINNGSILRGCDNMWRGIVATSSGASVVTNDCWIYDATRAIHTQGGNNVSVTRTRFYNDWIGIDASNYANTWVNFNVSRSEFRTMGSGLKFPLSGQNSLLGILVSNINQVNIMPVSMVNRNRFDKLQIGIEAYNTNVRIQNNLFTSIHDYNGINISGGVVLYNSAPASSSNNYLARIGATGTANDNRFLSSDFGISSFGYWRTDIGFNTLLNISEIGIYHFDNSPNLTLSTPQIFVHDNDLRNCFWGIINQDCYQTTSQIQDNGVLQQLDTKGSIGIGIFNKSLGSVKVCNNNTTEILGNDVKHCQKGINLIHASCTYSHDNTIKIEQSDPLLFESYGISIENSEFNEAAYNDIKGYLNSLNYPKGVGIYTFGSPQTELQCNIIKDAFQSMLFEGNSNMSYIHHNKMSNYVFGVSLQNKAIIGSQYIESSVNKAPKNWWQRTGSGPNFLYEYYTDNTVVGFDNRFYFQNTDINTFQRYNNLDLADNGTPTNTTSFPLGYTSPTLNLLFTTNSAVPSYADYCGGTNNPIAGGVENFTNGNVIQYGFGNPFPGEYGQMHRHQVIRAQKHFSDTLLTIILPTPVENYLDSLTYTASSTIDFVEEKLELKDYSNAGILNGSISGATEYEGKMQEINNLLIPIYDELVDDSIPTVDTTNLPSILNIANLCIYQYGDAVQKARLFLRTYIDRHLFFEDFCGTTIPENIPRIASLEQNSTEDELLIAMYPNPASDFVNVAMSKEISGTISVMDLNGRFVLQQNFAGNLFNINVSAITAGVYIVQVKADNSSEIRTFKLVVTH